MLFLLSAFITSAQGVFTFEEYLELVSSQHPIAVQSDLIVDQADAALQKSRGAFDPKVFIKRAEKEFESKDYFDLRNMGLKVPTWFGVEVKAGYEYNNGTYLNPENNVTDNGVSYLGVSVPLGQGLFIDERRAALKKAQSFKSQSEQQRIIQLNELYQNAIVAYLDWSKTYQQLKVYKDAVAASKRRYEGFRTSFQLGAIPAVDTLESLIQYQNRQLTALTYKNKYIKSTNVLNTFLWYEGTTPLELSDSLIPEDLFKITIDMDSCKALFLDIDNQVISSPGVKYYDFKIQQLKVDRRMSYEMLKPQVDVNYNLLGRDLTAPDVVFDNNYKWGLDLSFPVLFRKGRGEYRKAKFKLQSAELDRDLKTRSLKTKLNATYLQLLVLEDQINLYELNTQNYQRLLAAEQTKLNIGESSLFKLNAREIKWLEAQSKLFEGLVKQRTLYFEFYQQLGAIQ